MIRRIGPVESAAATRTVGVTVRRTDQIATPVTGGIAVVATEPELLATLGGTLADGRFLDDALGAYPAVVLGSEAAARLGIDVARRPAAGLARRAAGSRSSGSSTRCRWRPTSTGRR